MDNSREGCHDDVQLGRVDAQMDNAGEGCHDDSGPTLNPRLPAIIPRPVARRSARPDWRLILVAAFASVAGIVMAVLWPWSHHDKPGPVVTALLPGHGLARENEASDAGDTAHHNPATTRLAAKPLAGIDSEACHVNLPAPHLVVTTPPTVLHADEPASLGVSVDGASEGAQLVICGFAAKSVFSAGRSIDDKTWTLPASETADATIIPPRGFVGEMKLAIVLVNSDKSLADRRTLHVQWLPPTPAMPGVSTVPQRTDVTDLNRLLDKGVRLRAAGNLADARLVFSWIALTGDSRAAFLLAETYDPISLAKGRLLPADSDLEQARMWYRRAADLGSHEASYRLERLANW